MNPVANENSRYRPRAADRLLEEVLSDLPALMVVGPRACGKTTSAARLAKTVVRLDKPAEGSVFSADPDAALGALEEPILLDEWQVVPTVLGAVKRAVDTDFRPGRFLLTGSVRADLEAPGWPGTGRVVRVPMFGLTVAEMEGRADAMPLLDRLVASDEMESPANPPDIRGYVELALRTGFPEAALAKSEGIRERWIESYIEQIITRDAVELVGLREPDKLRRFFQAYSLNSAGLVNDQTLIEAAGMTRKTGSAYEQLLVNLMVVERLPAWSTNRLKRLVRSPKRYIIDAGLMAGALGIEMSDIMRDGGLLGRLLDTFVTAQLRSSLAFSSCRPRLYHLREEKGRHEVDLIAEVRGGGVIAIEIKATSAPKEEDAKHLFWLRDKLGEKFIRGVVLHTGPRVFKLGERVLAVPMAGIWG